MYAIVEIGGMQYKVAKSATVCVPKMNIETGKKVDLDRVLLIVDGETVNMGTPIIDNAVVKATVVSHFKDDKVLVFKKKRRKTYRVLRGHRQNVTELKIDTISVGKSEKKTADISESKPAPKKTVAKPKAAAEKKAVAKKTVTDEKPKKVSAKSSEKKEA